MNFVVKDFVGNARIICVSCKGRVDLRSLNSNKEGKWDSVTFKKAEKNITDFLEYCKPPIKSVIESNWESFVRYAKKSTELVAEKAPEKVIFKFII
jgi:hypothetical protein